MRTAEQVRSFTPSPAPIPATSAPAAPPTASRPAATRPPSASTPAPVPSPSPANPDFETKSSYNFTVVATDAAGNGSERAVSLAINNRDDSAPTITSGATATAIDENSGANRLVYTVTSTDTGDVSGVTTYSLKAGGDAAAFSINASTGAVHAHRQPQLRDEAQLQLHGGGYRYGGQQRRTSSLVWRSTTWTRWRRRSPHAATATAINENSGADQVVYTVTSTDTGDISTGSTTYSLKAGADAGAFSINASTGAVTLTGEPELRGEVQLQLHGDGHGRGRQQQRTGGHARDQQPGRCAADHHFIGHRDRDQRKQRSRSGRLHGHQHRHRRYQHRQHHLQPKGRCATRARSASTPAPAP